MQDTLTNAGGGTTDTALVLRKNPAHNVVAQIDTALSSLVKLANLYLKTEAAWHSEATLDAKQRDLQRFLSFYRDLYKHDWPEEWFVSVTKAFLKALQREKLAQVSRLQQKKLAQASLVRIYATVRHFARWLHRKFPALRKASALRSAPTIRSAGRSAANPRRRSAVTRQCLRPRPRQVVGPRRYSLGS